MNDNKIMEVIWSSIGSLFFSRLWKMILTLWLIDMNVAALPRGVAHEDEDKSKKSLTW